MTDRTSPATHHFKPGHRFYDSSKTREGTFIAWNDAAESLSSIVKVRYDGDQDPQDADVRSLEPIKGAPVIVLTTTGYVSDSWISVAQSSALIEQAEKLIRNLKTYRAALANWGEQYDLFKGSELPPSARGLGFKDPG